MSGAHVQSSGTQVYDNVSGAQVITMPGNFTAGSTGVLLLSVYPSDPTVTINGVTASKVKSQIDGGAALCFAEVWVADNLPGGGNTATVTFASGTYASCSVEEFSGLQNPAYSDGATNSNTNAGGTLATSVTSPTWAQPNMALVGVAASATGFSGDSITATPGSPWTEVFHEGNGSVHQVGQGVWQIVSSASPVTPSWTIDQGGGAFGNAVVVVGLLVAPTGNTLNVIPPVKLLTFLD